MSRARPAGVVLATTAAAVVAAVAAGAARERTVVAAPVTLAPSAAGNPTVAAGPGGEVFAAWAEQRGEGWDVVVARVGEDGAAAPSVRANTVAGDASQHEQAPPRVAVGPRGEVYVAWQKSTVLPGRAYPASDLRFARSDDGGRTFVPAVTVNDDAGGLPSSHTFHDLVAGPDGTLYLSWLDSRVRDSVRVARGIHDLPAAGGHGGHGARAAEPAEADLPGAEVRVAASRDGGRTWGPSAVVDGGVCPCCRTALAVGPDGAVYVAWRKVFPGGVRDVVVARSGDGGRTFSAPVAVHHDGWVFPGCPHAGPSLAVDGSGRVHVAWYTGREGRQGLWYAISRPGALAFGDPAALQTGGWVPPSQVKLAVDGEGVWLAWDDRRGPEKHLVVAHASGGGDPREVGEARAGTSPAVALAHGGAVVAYQDGQAVRLVRASGR